MLGLVWGCGSSAVTPPSRVGARPTVESSCPERLAAPDLPPGTLAPHRRLDTWTTVLASEVDLDTPLLDDDAREALATKNDRGPHRFDLGAPLDPRAMQSIVDSRQHDWAGEAQRGSLFDARGRVIAPNDLPAAGVVDSSRLEFHRARDGVSLRCTARKEAFYRSATDHRFDRNRCSYVERGELVQTIGHADDGQWILRTGSAVGYVDADDDAALGPALGDAEVADALRDAHRPRATFTRRHVLERAFAELGRAYGWGGENGGLDCSSFVQEVLATFGVTMPRHSADQADAASFRVDVPESMDDEGRRQLLDEANRLGLVLIHFPGHVMIYLGRDGRGTPMAIHSYAEYVEPCDVPDGTRTETLRLTHGVDVTTLELGRGTSRTSYLERMKSLSVFGRTISPPLERFVANRPTTAPPAATCPVADEPSIFRSPRRPYTGGAMRLVWVGEHDPGPAAVALTNAHGKRIELPIERLDGPPYGLVARWDHAEPGLWTAWFGDGEHRLACEHVVVEPTRMPNLRPVNSVTVRWSQPVEDLWSAFVQSLFDHPIDDRTWPNLQALLRDPERNLLFDHFTADEESRLALEPDCADLPFMLRAYFAWKMGLLFAVRPCSRGEAGRPPSCGDPISNVDWLESQDRPIDDFRTFVTTVVGSNVHSASARTSPRTNASDLYPVPLTREALRPGTLFADPYGHVMMIVRWVPAPPGGSGMLVAADAQPDGTIGRPRFWRGTFLFTPSTSDVGAGFKAFRPIERRDEELHPLPNVAIHGSRFAQPYSLDQYEGDVDSFYDRVEALIDPQPLDAESRLAGLIDALADSVERRTISVDNAERWLAEHPESTIAMPRGAEIFLTEGPWEDYSTPSRDLRLLLALDTVLAFPDAVRRRPERYGLAASDVDATVAHLHARLESELRSRTIRYTGTGGAITTLSLAEIRDRMRGFEVAYDPNDCPEIRWAAPAGSDELARCTRRAPADQQARLAENRSWFATRTRPIR